MSTTIQCLLADDNEMNREETRLFLERIPGINLIASCGDPFAARDILLSKPVDLVFLDIEMPGLSGIQLIKAIPYPPLFVFITSHASYAADGFEMDAVDFIVKPFTYERLMRAVNKASQLLIWKKEAGVTEQFRTTEPDSFFIKNNHEFIKIPVADVDYIESLGNFVNIYLSGGKKLIALVSLKNLEQQLPSQHFIRISRTHMVNRKKITAVSSTQISLHKLSFKTGVSYAEQVLAAVVGDTAIKRFID
jgi:two-component system, LytTR family, response regulator